MPGITIVRKITLIRSHGMSFHVGCTIPGTQGDNGGLTASGFRTLPHSSKPSMKFRWKSGGFHEVDAPGGAFRFSSLTNFLLLFFYSVVVQYTCLEEVDYSLILY
jgi:hypothetical protein